MASTPPFNPQRDEHRDNRGGQCDQSGEQGLPMIDEIDGGCVAPRHDSPSSRLHLCRHLRGTASRTWRPTGRVTVGASFVTDSGNRSTAQERRAGFGGPDKRPPIAARSVDCFFFCFSPIRQFAASGRNVHLTINQLFHSHFSHISATGDGRAVCKFIGGGGVVPHHSRRGRDRLCRTESASHAERCVISYM